MAVELQTITEEALRKRLVELRRQQDVAYSTLHAVDGAIQEVTLWLNTLSLSKNLEQNMAQAAPSNGAGDVDESREAID